MKSTRKNRFKKNRKADRARLRERIGSIGRALGFFLTLVATSGMFILAYDYFTQSGQFHARQIEVRGNQRLSRQQVLDIARIGPRTNILSVNLAMTRKRLMADPWIADATVSRNIPSGLKLQIREESPLAVLDMGGGEGFLINISGDVFKRQVLTENSEWPRVRGLGHGDLPVRGKSVTRAFGAVMTLLRLTGEPNSPLPLTTIRRIEIDPEIGATIFAGPDEYAVRLGFGHYRQKCEVLAEVKARLRNDSRLRQYRMIDLLDVNRIVVTLASAGASDTDDKEV